jgi:trans-2,3-dihydro-3-hydroxyanthranilate isomerase
MRYRFYTLDVFTDTPFGGNPLAVVLDADALSGERMQLIAAEFNLSETVFVLKPARAGLNRKKVRIFTPRAELPFAGHPTIGTSYLLAKLELLELDPADALIVLEEGVGDVPVKVQSGMGGPRAMQMSVPNPAGGRARPPPRGDIAAMLSLEGRRSAAGPCRLFVRRAIPVLAGPESGCHSQASSCAPISGKNCCPAGGRRVCLRLRAKP